MQVMFFCNILLSVKRKLKHVNLFFRRNIIILKHFFVPHVHLEVFPHRYVHVASQLSVLLADNCVETPPLADHPRDGSDIL